MMFKHIKSILVLGFLALVIGLFLSRNYFKTDSSELLPSSTFRVAILLPMSHPSLEEIQQGFVDTLKQAHVACSYDVYNANADRTLLRHQAEEAVNKNYDLIFTIATSPALIVKEVCDQRGSVTPVVAGAVDDPVEIKLIQSMESSGNNVTAVTGTENFVQQMQVLRYLKPDTKTILLVYNPTAGLDKQRKVLEKVCVDQNFALKTLEIFNMSDLIQKPQLLINDCDVVMVLKDNFVVSGIESLVTLCNRMHKTLYASDLNSSAKGAVLCYGVYEYQDGVESAYKAIEILKHGKKASQVASSMTSDFKVKLNTKYTREQNLMLDHRLLFLMQSSEVV
jgi:putative ABC transport system substrate-binding protein